MLKILNYKKAKFWAITGTIIGLVFLVLLITNQAGFNSHKVMEGKGYIIKNSESMENTEIIPMTYKIIGDETPAIKAIVDFYGKSVDPIVVYKQIQFEEGTLVLAEKLMDGEHYPDIHFVESNGKVTYLTRGSYCWTLNYTQFRGYNIFFGLAGAETRATGKNPIPNKKPVVKVEVRYPDKTESVKPEEKILAHINPRENDSRSFKNPQAYLIAVKGQEMPYGINAILEGGNTVSLSRISLEGSIDNMPDYLKVKNISIYNSFAFTFTPMLTPSEWEQRYVEGEICLKGKTDANGNLNALFPRPAGHMKNIDPFILPKDISPYYLSNSYPWSASFSPGEPVDFVYPESRKLLDCRILRLTKENVEKKFVLDNLTLITEKDGMILPKERGYYLLILRTQKEAEIQTYVGIFRIQGMGTSP